jgi:16S rRNA (guanine527-N7)-methyltransferase
MARPRSGAGLDKLLAHQPWHSLIPHIARVGADATTALERLRTYSTRVLEWNRGVSNIVSRNDEHRFVERHIAESIEPAHWLAASGAKRWLDFGSGAGLPAIPLALIGIGPSWTLVESRRMKTLFIRKAVEELELSGVDVVNSRLETLAEDDARKGAYDGFTSRATLSLEPTLVIAAGFVRSGGHAFLWKGSHREEEMRTGEHWREAWELDGLLGIGSGQTVVARFIRK